MEVAFVSLSPLSTLKPLPPLFLNPNFCLVQYRIFFCASFVRPLLSMALFLGPVVTRSYCKTLPPHLTAAATQGNAFFFFFSFYEPQLYLFYDLFTLREYGIVVNID